LLPAWSRIPVGDNETRLDREGGGLSRHREEATLQAADGGSKLKILHQAVFGRRSVHFKS
jgi:hypothetical protein